MTAEASQAAIRVAGLRKAFGRNQVLRGVDLTIPAGQVTVLMGANGAGKSTLVKVLCGVHAPDAGEVRLDDRPFAPASPSEALRAGVVTVHQNIDDGVVPDLDVASNLMLDSLAAGGQLFIDRRALRARAREIAASIGLDLDMGRQVADLTLADVAAADEVWLTSTPFALLPVTSLDGKPIGDGAVGPVYQQMLARWNDLVGLDIAAQALRTITS